LVAIGGVAAFVVVVVTLHFVQPGYDPSTQLMSELALGRYGGAMIVAFAGLSVAVFGIQASIGALGGGKGLRAIFLSASASFLAAGLFPLGATTEVHLAAIAAAFILSVLAMYLFPATAGSASQLLPRMVSWGLAAGVAVSISLGLFVIPMGVAQRAAACFLLVWLTLIGWRVSRVTVGERTLAA